MLKDKILINGKFESRICEKYVKKHYNEEYLKIHEFCELCGFQDLTWINKIYNYMFDIKEIPKCICGNNLNFRGRLDKVYTTFCSNKCSSISTAEKRMKTLKINNNIKYGVDNVFQLDNVKEKIKNTNLEKYGVSNPNKNSEIRGKIDKTNLEKYGFTCTLLNDKIKEKTLKTNLEKYGKEDPNQSEKVKERIKLTCIEKYGVDNPNKNKEVRVKINKTCLEKYGCINPFQNEEVKKKSKQSMMKNHGVEYSSQNVDIHNKIMLSGYKIKKFKDTDLYYQGTYELDFLNKYYDKLKIKRGETIMYEFNGELKAYHPDFYIEEYGLLVEIKSDYIWNKHLEENLAKVKHLEKNKIKYIIIMNKNYDEFIKKINLLKNPL